MLKLAGKTVRYGRVTALDGVTLRIADGARVAVTGPNGAGKTTLLKALAAAARVSGARRPAVAVVPQDIPATLALTVREFVMLGRTAHLSPWRAPSRDDTAAVDAALAATDTAALAARRLNAVSGGERQRLALALALATEAPCLLLDEPAAHLDFRRRDDLFDLLARTGKTVVAVVHDLPFDTAFFTRVILLSGGRIVADGAPDAVLTAANVSAAYGTPAAIVMQRTARRAVANASVRL